MTRRRKTSADHADRDASGLAAAAVKYVWPPPAIAASLFPPRVVLFVALFAWFLWAIVDLRLLFQECDMLFLWSIHYFTDFVGRPGSLLVWADKLLVQSCYHGWPAVAAIAVTVWILLVSTIGLMNALGRGHVGGTWLIPGVLLVSLYSDYLFPTSAVVGLTLAMAAANAWCRMPMCRPWLRLVLFVGVSMVLYYVVGEAYYCFAACAAIYEGLTKRRWLSGGLVLLAAVAVKIGLDAVLVRANLASHHFFAFTLAARQRAWWNWREWALYAYFPACALFAVFWQRAFASITRLWRRFQRRSKEEVVTAEPGKGGGENCSENTCADRRDAWTRPAMRWAAKTAVALSLAAAAGYASFDGERKLSLEIDYCAEHQQWDELMAKAKRLPPRAYSKYVNHDVNLALYHTGHLPQRMFSYPQRSRCPVLFIPEQVAPSDVRLLYKPFALLLELGRICEAERMAIESFETWPTGTTLKRLALTEMIKDQPANARVVLNVLRDDLVWGRWAQGYLQRLADDPSLAGDEEIGRLRGLMLQEDDLPRTGKFGSKEVIINPGVMLIDLLKRNGANRMAFEFFMAISLCNDDVKTAVQALTFLDGLPYAGIPPLYEEALLIYLVDHPEEAAMHGSAVLFRGRMVSAPTIERFQRLKQIDALNGGLNEKAEADVARELGDTYFYYYFYASRKRP